VAICESKKLTTSDIAVLQEYSRCIRDICWQRGENKVNMLLHIEELKDKLCDLGFGEYFNNNAI
jgi:hypothetical protein